MGATARIGLCSCLLPLRHYPTHPLTPPQLKEDADRALSELEAAARERDNATRELRKVSQRAEELAAANNGLNVRLKLAEGDVKRLQSTVDQCVTEKDAATATGKVRVLGTCA